MSDRRFFCRFFKLKYEINNINEACMQAVERLGYSHGEKKMMTVEGLKKLEDELHERKVIIRKEIADKIKEAREQG